jgi:hypothetical protein
MSIPFAQVVSGTPLAPFTVEISAAANDRYWDGAGVEHPLRRAGALYPLIAANLTVLTFARLCPDAMIQTRQRLVCHRRADAPATLRTTGTVSERYERRGRTYIVVETEISLDEDVPAPLVASACGAPFEASLLPSVAAAPILWTSTVVFTPAASLEIPR